ncbi:discoidin domain-containing protein [Pseudarthrobacter sp. O4]|uniref:discoidin domain-containing protein n=1 Tax=Pseudarthrobacter sp. O4 TaxID=3418417 RepID=UPI003CF25C8E
MTVLLIMGYVATAPQTSSGAAGSHVHSAALPAPQDSAGVAGPHLHVPEVLPAAATEALPAPMPRTGWTASSSDEEISGQNGRASNVLDGDAATFWHSKWTAPAGPLPHTITIDTKATQSISGFRYLPRSTTANGRVGSFEILVSTDGTTWSAPVAQGTWADSSAEKTVTFTAVSARYVRLIATAEAGDRGPWSSAAEINLVAGQTAPPTTEINLLAGQTAPAAAEINLLAGQTAPAAAEINLLAGQTAPAAAELVGQSRGSWGPTINFPIVPVAGALLPGNKLLTWSAYSPTAHGGDRGYTQTSILDLATGKVTQAQVANTGHDMFCPGTSMLPDGRIMVSGGSSSTKTSLYNPATNKWSPGPDMKIARGYQSNVTTSTGEVFTIGGSFSGGIGNKDGEVWSAAGGWRKLPNVLVDKILTADPRGGYRSDNHTWLFAAPGGRVFQAGPSRQMNWISTTGKGSITSAGPRADSQDAMNGDAVMYDVGKILTVGGATAYEKTPATARAYTIDINNGVKVARTADMAVTRSFANGVALPDGQVLVVGGQATPVTFTDTAARMAPEIWNPATGKWTTLAPMAIPRTYHSVGMLLPDGKVFVGGGGLCNTCTTNHLDGEIFTPPYLLNADGSARTRPKIVTAPASAATGSTIAVTTGAPVTNFSLMRMSTVTHTVNTDQRRIPLTATSVSGNTASLTLPADSGVLVPGSYMLFAMDANGVPSVASTIRITVSAGSSGGSSGGSTAGSATEPGTQIPITPFRALDTRKGAPVGADSSVSFQVGGVSGIPANVSAVTFNLTVTEPRSFGFAAAYASGAARPNASNLNFARGQTVPNSVTVPVGADGKVTLFNRSSGTTHFIADVSGYYIAGTPTAAGAFKATAPFRALDTRSRTAVGADSSVSFQVGGANGIPANVSAVTFNLTVTDPRSFGFAAAYASGAARPNASNLNFATGQTVPNSVTVPVGADGKVTLFNRSSGTTHFIADVSGYYIAGTPTVAGAFKPTAPFRALDTRSRAAVGADSTVSFQVGGANGIPAKVSAVTFNLTVTEPRSFGFAAAYAGTARPNASNLNFATGQTVPNSVTVPVGADGKVTLFNRSSGTTHFIADVSGYYIAGPPK